MCLRNTWARSESLGAASKGSTGDDATSSSPSAVDVVDKVGEVGVEISPIPSCAEALGGESGKPVYDVVTGS